MNGDDDDDDNDNDDGEIRAEYFIGTNISNFIIEMHHVGPLSNNSPFPSIGAIYIHFMIVSIIQLDSIRISYLLWICNFKWTHLLAKQLRTQAYCLFI